MIQPRMPIPSETVVRWFVRGEPRFASGRSLTAPIIDCNSLRISMYIGDCISGFLDLVEMMRNLRSAAKARSTADDYHGMVSKADEALLRQQRVYIPARTPDLQALHSC